MRDEAGPPVEVVTLGECLVALVAGVIGPLAEVGTFERHVAGSEANAAVGLARLGHRVALIGRVGADGFGTAILRRLRGEGVETSHLRVDPAASTGLLVRERRALGPAEVIYHRRGSAGSRLAPDEVEAAAELFGNARWLHLSGITPALSDTAAAAVDRSIELAREHGLTISLDVNLRRRLWTDAVAAPVLRALAARVDVVLAGADEAAVVTGTSGPDAADPGRLAAALLELGPSTAVLKLGGAGAAAQERGGRLLRRAALPVAGIVDPIGAGDAFSAGFIAARLEGRDLDGALEVAVACGAAAVATIGDLAGLPDRAELDRLLAAAGDDHIR